MSDDEIKKEDLQKEIEKILKDADLAKTSSKKVLQKLEENLGVDLASKKKMIDQMVMDYVNSCEYESEEEEEEEEVKPKKIKKKGSDDEWGGGTRSAKKAGGGAGAAATKSGGRKAAGGGKGKGGGYTRPYKLSPALAELMGKDEMPRHEVVKRVWEIIKEDNLYDPKNKQFAICNDALYKVFGIQRFRTFGMMKYLKNHFLLDE